MRTIIFKASTTIKSLFTIKGASIVTIVISAALSGCATYDNLTQEECQSADWNAVGYDISMKGYKSSSIENFKKSCGEHGITPNETEFLSGYNNGLTRYCTTAHGYEIGKKNDKYRHICPDELEPEFKRGYNSGKMEYRQNESLKKQKFNRRVDF